MITKKLYENQDATIPSISIQHQIDCGQDMRWLLQLKKEGTNGDPFLFIEESNDGQCWTNVPDLCNPDGEYFIIDDSPYAIRDSYFMGKYIRLRIEPNNNTSGTITANLGIKTKSV